MIFAAQGFEGVSLRAIATESGVAHSLIRHHFGSKEAIWRTVIDSTLEEFLEILRTFIAAAEEDNVKALTTAKAVSRELILIAAQYPEVPRLVMYEGADGGERLDYFMRHLAPLQALMAPIIATVQREGGLSRYTNETFLLSLLMLGTMPFAMSAFSSALCHVDILTPEQVEQHADQVIATLFFDIPQ